VDNFYKAVLASATADKVIFDGDWSGFDSRFVNKIVYSLMEKDTPDPVIVPEVPAPVITDPVIAPSPVPVPGVPAPEKDDGGSKKWIIIGAAVAVVVGIVIAVVV
jgi:hypothetical protein